MSCNVYFLIDTEKNICYNKYYYVEVMVYNFFKKHYFATSKINIVKKSIIKIEKGEENEY